jgi:hypothetical protein
MKSRKVDLRRLATMTVVLIAVMALGSAVIGIGNPWSIAAGGAVMLANYHLIRMLVSQLIRPRLGKAGVVFLFASKFGLFFALVAGAFYRLPIEPRSFAVGATQLLVAAVIEASIMGEPLDENGDSRIT